MLVNDVYAQVKDGYLEKSGSGGVNVVYVVGKVQEECKNNYGDKAQPNKNTILSQMDMILMGEKLTAAKRRYGTPQVAGWRGWREKEG